MTTPDPETEDAEAPVVLVVEDHADLLKHRLDNFAAHGIEGVGATSAEDAAAFLASGTKPVSLVMVDVNLRPDDPADRSGLSLARFLNVAMSGVRLVGYSAHFEEGAITEGERELFSDWIPKGQALASEIADSYAGLAQDVSTASSAFTLDNTDEAAGALAGFLAETERMQDDRVLESRAFLHSTLNANPYDPSDGENEPYDPFDQGPHGAWALPELPDVAMPRSISHRQDPSARPP